MPAGFICRPHSFYKNWLIYIKPIYYLACLLTPRLGTNNIQAMPTGRTLAPTNFILMRRRSVRC